HFDGPIRNLKTFEDKEVMREFALSSFGEILHADAQSPAMIYYLDTFSSTKEAPNENYGRELMELHTLGVDGPYTHQDIDEIARCFTGWGINRRTGDFFFSRRNHDDNEKIVLGNIIPAGGGIDDGMQVLDILAAHDSTAEFISKKLCVHFIEDEPSDEIIQSTSQVFKDTGGDIKSILKHILMSEQFMQASDAKFKRPFHYVASCIGALNGELRTGRRVMRQIKQLLESLGNSPFDWQTPDGYPDYASHWLSTSGMLLRWNFASLFSFGELRGLRYELDTLFTAPFTASNIVNQIQHKIIRRDFELNDKITLLNYLQEDADDDDGIVSETKIQAALTIVLSSAYFQLI
ncbi:MAG TPA: DUF1800 domain-containing protein, partial [Oceanospirillales bacterium]|nr:DUF1800 domain-containing protein [Oceanospirillales bacterium]